MEIKENTGKLTWRAGREQSFLILSARSISPRKTSVSCFAWHFVVSSFLSSTTFGVVAYPAFSLLGV